MENVDSTVHVALSERAYDIQIGTGLLDQVGPQIGQWCQLTHAVVIADTNVQQYADRVVESIQSTGARADHRCPKQ